MTARALLGRKLRRDLRRRRAQVAAVAITVFVGLAVFVLSAGMAANLGDSYDVTYERTAFADVWVTGGDQGLAAELERLPGVERVERRTVADLGVTFTDRPIRTRVVGSGPDTRLNELVVSAGTGVPADGGGVVLEQHAADNFDLGVGDTIDVAGFGPVPIVGVAVSPEWLWVAPSQQEVIVDPDEFAVVFAPESLASTWSPDTTQLVVAVADNAPALVAEVEALALAAGAGEIVTRATHPSAQNLEADVEGFAQLSIMFPILFLGAAGLATSVLLSRLVAQQRSEIAMLRANGYGDGTVRRHYSFYGVVVALLGAIPAIPVGVAGSWAATAAYTSFLGVPFASRQLHPWTWAAALGFAVLVGGGSGWLASRQATAIAPAEAMRPGGGAVPGRRTILDRILPAGAPSWLRLAVRNLVRTPGRSVTTALGVVLALLLTMTALVLNDTITDIFTTQFTEVDQRGLVVTLDGPADDEALATVAALDGVSVVEPHLEVPASLVALGTASASGDQPVETELLQIYAPGTELHDFSEVGGLGAAGIVLSSAAADSLAADVGDQVEVRGLDGTTGPVTVAAVISEPFSGSSYLSTDAWRALGGPEPSSLAVGLDDRSAHETVRDQVASLDGVIQISDRVATAEQTEQLLAGSRFFVGVILVLAVLMAIALIFNALAVTIGERETEVATLQANGVGRRWIRRTITAENLTTVLFGLIPGLVLGWISAGAFIRQFSTDQFTLEPVLRPGSLVAAIVVLVGCALVAQIPGLRRLDRLDLAAKVRERAL